MSTITTVIPTYRRPQLLRRAIQSVLRQSYPDFLIYVCDNASGDETASVVKEFGDKRIIYFCQKSNIGAPLNFKFGMELVKTPYFSFLSDDDVLLPHFYEVALKGFRDHPGVAFSAGSAIHMSETGKVHHVPLAHWPREGLYNPPEGLLNMLHDKLPQWCAILFETKAAGSIGGIDKEVGPPFDYDFLLRMAERFPFVISKEPCALFVVHPDSASSIGGLRFAWPGWLKMIDNMKRCQEVQQSLIRELRMILISTAAKAILANHFEEAKETVSILRDHFHLKWTARALSLFGWVCKRSRLRQAPFRRVWRFFFRKEMDSMAKKRQGDDEHLAKWLCHE